MRSIYSRAVIAGADVIGFVHTADVARARHFYVEVLGLEFVEESPFALVVRSGSTMIRVTPVEGHRASGHTVLGWSVSDAAAAVDDLASHGVEMLRFDGLDQDARGMWHAPGGATIAWFSDPDGNTLSLTQF